MQQYYPFDYERTTAKNTSDTQFCEGGMICELSSGRGILLDMGAGAVMELNQVQLFRQWLRGGEAEPIYHGEDGAQLEWRLQHVLLADYDEKSSAAIAAFHDTTRYRH